MNTHKKHTLRALALAICLTSPSISAQEKSPAPTSPENNATTQLNMSYGLGYQNGEQFASYGFIADDLNKDAYIKGLIDALMKKEFANDELAYDKAMKAYDKIIADREKNIASTNAQAEKKFLEKNSKRNEIISTPSKLQYQILKKGTGKTYSPPKEAVNGVDQTTQFFLKCKGTLLDGSVFMETPGKEAVPFNLQLIPGLVEALKIMPIGSKWKLYIPSALGFGDLRQGPKISPKSMLIYEIELTDIKKNKTPLHQHIIPK